MSAVSPWATGTTTTRQMTRITVLVGGLLLVLVISAFVLSSTPSSVSSSSDILTVDGNSELIKASTDTLNSIEEHRPAEAENLVIFIRPQTVGPNSEERYGDRRTDENGESIQRPKAKCWFYAFFGIWLLGLMAVGVVSRTLPLSLRKWLRHWLAMHGFAWMSHQEFVMWSSYFICLALSISMGWESFYARGTDSNFVWGHFANIHLVLGLLPIQRHNFFGWCLGVSYDHFLPLHRFFMWISLTFGYLHLLTEILHYDLWIPIDTSRGLFDNNNSIAGTISLLAMSVIGFTALGKLRRWAYNAFYMTHLIFWPIAIFFAICHNRMIRYCVLLPLCLQLLDLGLRYWLQTHGQLSYRRLLALRVTQIHPTKQKQKSHSKAFSSLTWPSLMQVGQSSAQITLMERLPSGVENRPGALLQFTLGNSSTFTYDAGQFIFLNIPALSLLEWHPFSITSSPLERVLLEFTRKIDKRNRKEQNPNDPLKNTFTLHVLSMGKGSFSARVTALARYLQPTAILRHSSQLIRRYRLSVNNAAQLPPSATADATTRGFSINSKPTPTQPRQPPPPRSVTSYLAAPAASLRVPPPERNHSIVIPGEFTPIPVRIEGPYGMKVKDNDALQLYPVVVLIGGGIGVTPLMSILSDIIIERKLLRLANTEIDRATKKNLSKKMNKDADEEEEDEDEDDDDKAVLTLAKKCMANTNYSHIRAVHLVWMVQDSECLLRWFPRRLFALTQSHRSHFYFHLYVTKQTPQDLERHHWEVYQHIGYREDDEEDQADEDDDEDDEQDDEEIEDEAEEVEEEEEEEPEETKEEEKVEIKIKIEEKTALHSSFNNHNHHTFENHHVQIADPKETLPIAKKTKRSTVMVGGTSERKPSTMVKMGSKTKLTGSPSKLTLTKTPSVSDLSLQQVLLDNLRFAVESTNVPGPLPLTEQVSIPEPIITIDPDPSTPRATIDIDAAATAALAAGAAIAIGVTVSPLLSASAAPDNADDTLRLSPRSSPVPAPADELLQTREHERDANDAKAENARLLVQPTKTSAKSYSTFSGIQQPKPITSPRHYMSPGTSTGPSPVGSPTQGSDLSTFSLVSGRPNLAELFQEIKTCHLKTNRIKSAKDISLLACGPSGLMDDVHRSARDFEYRLYTHEFEW